LRWDVEEDLSRVVGDQIAHRLGETARRGAEQSKANRERIESGLRQFLVEDGRQLVDRSEFEALRDANRALEDSIARLEARLLSAGSPSSRF
jgi:ubiquinone biosynthesis protein UbiJ